MFPRALKLLEKKQHLLEYVYFLSTCTPISFLSEAS